MSIYRPLVVALGRFLRIGTSDVLDLSNPVNAQTGTTYTLALSDGSSPVTCTNASAITVTVPPNGSVALPIGTEIEVMQGGAGQVTFAPGIAVTLNSASGNLSISAQGGKVKLRKTGTNTWYLSGDLTVTSNVIARDATELSVTTTAAKTTVYSFTVPANKLGTDKTLAIEIAGDLEIDSGSCTLTVTVDFGGATMYADASLAQTILTTRHPWFLNLRLSEHAGVTNSQVLSGMLSMGTAAGATTGEGDLGQVAAAGTGFNTPVYGTGSIDTTAAQTLTVSFTMSVSNSLNNWKRENAIAYMLGEGQKGDTGATGATGTAGVGASSITENPQSGTTYTLVLADKGKVVTCTNAGAITLTVPTNASVAFTAGDVIYVCQGGAGAVTIAAAGGVTLKKPYTLVTAVQDAWLSLVYMGSDVWRVTGQST